jgi:hypothetical protein
MNTYRTEKGRSIPNEVAIKNRPIPVNTPPINQIILKSSHEERLALLKSNSEAGNLERIVVTDNIDNITPVYNPYFHSFDGENWQTLQEMAASNELHPVALKNIHLHLIAHFRDISPGAYANSLSDLLLIKASVEEKYFLGELKGLSILINVSIIKNIDSLSWLTTKDSFVQEKFCNFAVTLLAFVYTVQELFDWDLSPKLKNLNLLTDQISGFENSAKIEKTSIKNTLTNYVNTLSATFYSGFDERNQQVITSYAQQNGYLTKTNEVITKLHELKDADTVNFFVKGLNKM